MNDVVSHFALDDEVRTEWTIILLVILNIHEEAALDFLELFVQGLIFRAIIE